MCAKKLFPLIIFFLLFIFTSSLIYSQTTYTWNVNGAGAWTNAINWTPNRNVPAANDILVVDGSVTPGPVILSNVPIQTIGQFHLLNNVYVTFNSTAQTAITISGLTGEDFTVPAGCTLVLGGGNRNSIELSVTSTGLIGGDIVFNATAANQRHRIISNAGGALVFQSGSSAAMAPQNGANGGGFGDTNVPVPANGGVIFLAGSTYYQGGWKNGTRSPATGTNPFGLNAPQAAVIFNPGSTYLCWDGAPSVVNRTYGNFIWRGSISQPALGGAGLLTVNGNFIVRNSGIVAQGNIGFSGHTGGITVTGNFVVETGSGQFIEGSAPTTTQYFSIGGDVDIQDAALFIPTTDTDRVYRLNGSVNQNVNFAGTYLPNLTVNNSAGVTLTGDVGVTGTLNDIAGSISTGDNTLNLGTTSIVDGAIIVNNLGTLNCTAPAITGLGNISVESGGTLVMRNAGGVDGQITTSGTNTYSTGANYSYFGSVAQVTGVSLPPQVNNLTVNNSLGVTLSDDVAVNGALTDIAGNIATTDKILSLGPTTVIDDSLTVNNLGTLNCSSASITGLGDITVESGATLVIRHAGGIDEQIKTSGINTYSTGANYSYLGNVAQITGLLLPTQINNFTVNNSMGVTLSGNVTVNGTLTGIAGNISTSNNTLNLSPTTIIDGSLTVNNLGTLNCNNSAITGLGNVVVESGGTLVIRHAGGIDGQIATSGINTYSTGANYSYLGSVAQVTGLSLPSQVNNLTVDNLLGVTLSGNVAVNGVFTDVEGNTQTANNSLSLSSTTTVDDALTVNNLGTLNCSDSAITGGGNITVESGGTLVIRNAGGIDGQITTLGINTFSIGANYSYLGSVAQITGLLLPSQVNNLTVDNIMGVTLSGNIDVNGVLTNSAGNITTTDKTLSLGTTTTVDGSITVNNSGTLSCSNTAITGLGNVVVESGATLVIRHAGGIDGQITSSGISTFSAGANYFYSGSVAQVTGTLLPIAVNNLVVNNSSGVALTGDVTVSGLLNLIGGELITGSRALAVPDGALGVIRTSGFVNGTLIRAIDATNTGIRSFPIGTTGKYVPVVFEIKTAGTGTGTLAVNSTDGDHPNLPGNSSDAINRYWNLTASGISGITADITFAYLDGDLDTVDETLLIGARFINPTWEEFGGLGSIRDIGSNTVKVVGATTFSDWTLCEEGTPVTDWMLN